MVFKLFQGHFKEAKERIIYLFYLLSLLLQKKPHQINGKKSVVADNAPKYSIKILCKEGAFEQSKSAQGISEWPWVMCKCLWTRARLLCKRKEDFPSERKLKGSLHNSCSKSPWVQYFFLAFSLPQPHWCRVRGLPSRISRKFITLLASALPHVPQRGNLKAQRMH